MKHTFKSAAILMAILSMAACKKENFKEAEPVQGGANTFTCSFDDTKAVAKDGIQTFKAGEKIDLMNNEKRTVTSVTIKEEWISNGGKTVTFTSDYPNDKPVLAVYPGGYTESAWKGANDAILDNPHFSCINSKRDGFAVAVAGAATEGSGRVLAFNNVLACISFSSSVSADGTNKWAVLDPIEAPGAEEQIAVPSQIEVNAATGEVSVYPAKTTYLFTNLANDYKDDIRLWMLPQTFENGFQLRIGSAAAEDKSVKKVNVTKAFTVKAGQFIRLGDIDVETPPFSAKQIDASGTTATINWSYWGEEDLTKDYKVWLYDDEACQSIHFAMTIPKSANVFKAGKGTNFIFSGLTPSTTYYAKVTDGESETPVIPVTTTEAFGFKTVPETEAVAGDVILKEDFSELIYSGDVITSAAGYAPAAAISADAKVFDSLGDSFVPATGDEPEGYAPAAYNKTFYLGIAASKAISASRFNGWGTIGTIKMHRVLALCNVINIGATDYLASLATPELTCLKEGSLAKLEVKFKASTWAASSRTGVQVGTVAPGATVAERASGYTDFRLTGTSTQAGTLDIKYGWDEYTVTIDDVVAGSRVYFGNVSYDSGEPSRFVVKDIQITLVEYKEKTGFDKAEVNVGGAKTALAKKDFVFEGDVDIPAEGSFTVELDGQAYGFLTQSGAGGLGTCTNTKCAVPVEAAKWSKIPFYVRKAKGTLALSAEGGNDFWTSIPAAGKMHVVIDTEPTDPTYTLRLVEEVDPKVVIDETFDLLLGGGDYRRANRTYEPASSPYGVWGKNANNYTTPAFNGGKWYGDPDNTTLIPYSLIEGLEIADWVGTQGSYFAFQVNCLHIGGSSTGIIAEVYSPYFKGLASASTVQVTLDLMRFASGTTCDFTLDLDGPGTITEGSTTVDYVEWDGEPKTQDWTVESNATSYVLQNNDYFPATKDWGNHPDSPSSPTPNNTIDKPLSHMVFTVEGATAETRIHLTSGTSSGRLQIHGMKVVKK